MYEYFSYSGNTNQHAQNQYDLSGEYINDYKAIRDCFDAIGKVGPRQIVEFLDHHKAVFVSKYPGTEIGFIEFIKTRIRPAFEPKGTSAPIYRMLQGRIDEWINKALLKITATELEEYNQTTGAAINRLPSSNSNQTQEINLIGEKQKLKWKCTPSVAGFIISELFRAGYIECPNTNGEPSFNKLAELCMNIFHVEGKHGSTTLEYWKKVVNPAQNQLADNRRARLKITDLSELD